MSSNKGRIDVIDCFLAGKTRRCGNYRTDGEELRLFGNLIAFHKVQEGADDLVVLRDAHHRTASTKGALNDLLRRLRAGVRIWQEDFAWYVSSGWTTTAAKEPWQGGLEVSRHQGQWMLWQT